MMDIVKATPPRAADFLGVRNAENFIFILSFVIFIKDVIFIICICISLVTLQHYFLQ